MTQITAKKDEEFTLSLKEGPTTGYIWEAQFDEDFLTLKGRKFEPDSPTAIGGGGTATFTFIPLKSGEAFITMQCKRPWEGNVLEEKSFQVTINE